MIVIVLPIKNVCPAHVRIVKWIRYLMVVLVLPIKTVCPGTEESLSGYHERAE